jgi:transaldolase/glucose-6-phosphate isomerase
VAHACRPGVPFLANPGVLLGALLGILAERGRDKVTLLSSPGVRWLGGWLEQLLAESTGKQGKGLIPVDGERPAPPDGYGADRLFLRLRLAGSPEPEMDRAVARIEEGGQPVVEVLLRDPYDLAAEFFRWEFATAVAGALLGVNPFDQPDVEASKAETRRLTSEYAERGALPAESPFAQGEGVLLFADPRNAAALREAAGPRASVPELLRAHLGRLRPGDYFALLAWVEMSEGNDAPLQAIRHAVRDARRVATCLGYGPRFLHSTGQAHKGGPDTGLFLQITCDDAEDVPVPGERFGFAVVKAAQARGDLEVLAARGRRALRVHLGKDAAAGLETLRGMVQRALAG